MAVHVKRDGVWVDGLKAIVTFRDMTSMREESHLEEMTVEIVLQRWKVNIEVADDSPVAKMTFTQRNKPLSKNSLARMQELMLLLSAEDADDATPPATS